MTKTINKPTVSIVVPTIREESLKKFLKEWKFGLLENPNFDTRIVIIEDNPEATFNLEKNKKISHYSWSDIKKDLGRDSWIIPRRTDCIRSYGYWKAWRSKPDFIVTLDDDCYPYPRNNFLNLHWSKLLNPKYEDEIKWVSTTKESIRPRGLPYRNFEARKTLKTVLNHGLWYNVPDLDAETQLSMKKSSGLKNYLIEQIIPKGIYYPMCGMNLAWMPKVTVGLYFLLMGEDENGNEWGVHRFGDIWAGIIFKKLADHLNYTVASGSPLIWHDRASNPQVNLIRERVGKKMNESFWQSVDSVSLSKSNMVDCYKELATKLPLSGNYWDRTKRAMKIWATLYT